MVLVRRGRLAVAALCLAILIIVAAAPAGAQTPWEQPDQSVGASSVGIAVIDNQVLSQVFTAGRTAELGRVDLPLERNTGSLIVQIRTTTGGVPDGELTATPEQVLTSATVSVDRDGIDTVRFSQPITVVEGTQYAIVLIAGPADWWWWKASDIEYAGGLGRSCTLDACWRVSSGHSGYSFTTYLREPDTVQPTGTLSINAGDTYTNTTGVTLNLTCQDALSGCHQVQFSTEGPDEAQTATPVPYAESIPLTLPSGDGPKTVYLRFIDLAGNTSSIVSDTIELDTTPPETDILTSPPTYFNQNTAVFTFESNEADSTFVCHVQPGGPLPCQEQAQIDELVDGTYTFSVVATDPAGNTDPTPATWTWTVDTVRPTVSVNQAITQPDPTNATSVTFEVKFSEPVTGFDSTDLVITHGPNLSAPTISITPSGGPASDYTVTLSNLIGDGDISASVIENAAQDAAGNSSVGSTSIDNTVTIDQTPPETMFSGGPPAITNATSATFVLPNDDNAYTCTLDSGTPTACTESYSVTGLAEGAHTVTIIATDPAGNIDPTPATHSWTIDVTNPTIQPIQNVTIDPEEPGGAIVFFPVVVSDNLTPLGSLVTACDDGGGNLVFSGQLAPIGTTVVTCTVTDQAGNQSSTSFTITVRSVGSLWADLGVALVELGLPTSTERTLMTQMAVAQALANAGQPGMACQQLNVLDMSVKSQESKRRIDRRDAAAIYAQTQQLRNVIGCGGARG